MPECAWDAQSEVYDADGREWTVWRLVAATGETLERTRHPWRLPEITAQYRAQGWTIPPGPPPLPRAREARQI